MKSAGTHQFLRIIKDQSGQILPWMVFLNVLFLGAAGLTLDLGHAYVCYRELQASTDAAALAGAYAMASSTATSTSVKAAVTSYSSMSTGANADANLPSPTINTTLSCLTTVTNQGVLCSSSTTGDNAIVVTQTTTVPTLFIRALGVFGINSATSLTLSATSTAAMRGATNSQENVAIVIDTTASMASSDSDASCNNTRIYCALQGVQTLLAELTPCTASSTSSSCTGYDGVSLFTFPNIQANQASDDTTCPTSNPTYSFLLHANARGNMGCAYRHKSDLPSHWLPDQLHLHQQAWGVAEHFFGAGDCGWCIAFQFLQGITNTGWRRNLLCGRNLRGALITRCAAYGQSIVKERVDYSERRRRKQFEDYRWHARRSCLRISGRSMPTGNRGRKNGGLEYNGLHDRIRGSEFRMLNGYHRCSQGAYSVPGDARYGNECSDLLL